MSEEIQHNEDNWEEQDVDKKTDDPLLECLMELCKLHNLPATRTSLRAGLPLVHNRLTVELFSRAAERAGLDSRVVKRPVKAMNDLELPAILLLSDKRACLLKSIDHETGTATIQFPETGLGQETHILERIEEKFLDNAIFVLQVFQKHKQI